ncbi:MAG TPA: isochorismate synthase [Acidimicrobiia bacterium]|jgi:menaquinone-specific isochorismate synthase|nr:isochorismate synthase [Acidimicrobiia bacterium]
MTAAREPGLVVATTRRVADPGDLLDALGTGGFAWFAGDEQLVTAGVAATVAPRDALAFLRSIERAGDSGGRGARAVGALPFANTVDGVLVVPARIVERDADGHVWSTTVAPASAPPAADPAPRGRIARRFTVEARQGLDEWDAMVTAALALVETDALEKVVLAREVVVDADAPFEPATIVERLRATQPDCIVYAAGGFVGATPELLVRRSGREVVSQPMAGTVPRAASPEEDRRSIVRLVSSVKESREHRLVVDAVAGEMARWCDDVVVGEPEPRRLTSVTHLTTRIAGTLRRRDATALDLALALHPTPAVNGAPAAAARAAIARLERFERGPYSGPVGWVDAAGDGEFAVALRGATLEGHRARLLAGAGIVAGSDPDAEWAETQAKLEPMLRALVRP